MDRKFDREGMMEPKFRTVTPPAFRRASERDPSELPECLDRMKKFLLDRVEQDCRSFARAIAEWRDNRLWEHFNDSWEEFVAEHIGRPIEWVDHMVEGIEILDKPKPEPASDPIDLADMPDLDIPSEDRAAATCRLAANVLLSHRSKTIGLRSMPNFDEPPSEELMRENALDKALMLAIQVLLDSNHTPVQRVIEDAKHWWDHDFNESDKID